MLHKPFGAMLLLIILIATSTDGKTATQKQAVMVGVQRAVDGIRHQLPKRVDEVTTLTNAYIDPNDGRKAVFVSTLSVPKDDIDQKKWQDLGRKLRNQACTDELFKDSVHIATCACSTATLTNTVKLSVSFSSTIADRFSLRPLSTIVSSSRDAWRPCPPSVQLADTCPPGDFGQWPKRPESVRVFRCLIRGRPDVIAGQIDVLPAKRRQMREQFVWDLLGRAQGGDGAVEIAGVPKDDGRDQQVQPRRTVLLILISAVADFSEPVNEHGPRQAVA